MRRIKRLSRAVGFLLVFFGICRGNGSVTIAWDPSTVDVDGQVLEGEAAYVLIVNDLSGGESRLVDAGTLTQASVDGLDYNKTYEFKVKAYTAVEESELSEGFVWSASQLRGPTVAWDPSSKDINGQVLEGDLLYKLFVGDVDSDESWVVDAGLFNQACVAGLEYNRTYTFKAKAYTAEAESEYSEEILWAAPVMPDADEDGLCDSWEYEHFQTLDLTHAASDFDGDGESDRTEFLAGTNPADARDFRVMQMINSAAGPEVVFQARQAAGSGYENRTRLYTLMRCNDLVSGEWTVVPGLEQIEGTGQTVNYAQAMEESKVFYGLRIQLN